MRRALVIKVIILALSTSFALGLGGPMGWALAALSFLLGVAVLLAIMFSPNTTFWAPTVFRAPEATDAVALTFDDGPDPEFTRAVMDILKRHDVPAAFFVVGERVEAHPEVVSELHRAGHLICNHSHTHSFRFHFGLWKTFRRELRDCNRAIGRLIQKEPTLFRAPQGGRNPALGDVLFELDMTAVGWQARGVDAVSDDARAIEERVVRTARPGGVILLHDGTGLGGLSDRAATLEALPRIIERLKAKGLRFIRLDALLKVDPYRAAAT